MNEDCGGIRKIDAVTNAIQKVAVKMVQRSTKGTTVSPRYRVAMFAYSSYVIDLLGGIKTIEELAKMGVPKLTTLDMTDTAAAFLEAERLLTAELPKMEDHPAPLICHMTDGDYNGSDPEPIARRIQTLAVPDGNILIENIFVKSGVVRVSDVKTWSGISSVDELSGAYARKLFEMSSPIPESYRNVMREFGYQLDEGARMLFPGDKPDLVELGFVMSGATPVTRAA
jgi:hypothetical protein